MVSRFFHAWNIERLCGRTRSQGLIMKTLKSAIFAPAKIMVWIMCSMLLIQNCHAVSLGSMAKAASELIALKAGERASGVMIASLNSTMLAASIATQAPDSRYQKTLAVAEISVVGLVGAAAAFFGAPAWAAVGIATGVEVAYHIGSSYFTRHSDGTVTASALVSSPGASYSPTDGSPCMSVSNISDWCSSSGASFSACIPTSGPHAMENPTLSCSPGYASYGYSTISSSFDQAMTVAGLSQPVTSTPVSIADAISGLSSADLASPADPLLVAATVNAIWNSASGVGTIPYDSANPITAADVAAYAAASPTTFPTNADILASPVSAAGTVALPIPGAIGGAQTGAVIGTTTSTTTNTATGSTTTTNSTSLLDWGTFVAPAVESPSIESILDPLFNMFPSWKTFAFPSHSSVCPTPSFSLPSGVMGGRTVTFDQMCSFLEYSNTRIFMEAAFSVAWSILIIFIIMGA